MAAVPYLCLWLFGVGWGFCVDGLFNAGVLSVVAVRRISAAFGRNPGSVGRLPCGRGRCNGQERVCN